MSTHHVRSLIRVTLKGLTALLVVLLLLLSIAPQQCLAQTRRFSVGDEVLVPFMGKPTPGTVIKTDNRGRVMVQYDIGISRTDVFHQSQVMFAFEKGALARARTWKDSSGKFQVFAAVLQVRDGVVTLRKKDGKEIEVALEKLSAVDRGFVEKLDTNVALPPADAPELPDVEQFTEPMSARPVATVTQRQAIEPDPIPTYAKVTPARVAIPAQGLQEELTAVMVVGGPDMWVLCAFAGPELMDVPSRLVWASLERQKAEGQQLLGPGEVVLDYHPVSHRLLTYKEADPMSMDSLAPETDFDDFARGVGERIQNRRAGRADRARRGIPGDLGGLPKNISDIDDFGIGARPGGVLTLWEVQPTDRIAQPIVRWDTGPSGMMLNAPWGRIIDGELVVFRQKLHEYVAWNTTRKATLYRIKQESFHAPEPVLSGHGRYLFLPEDKQVKIVETSSGETLSTLPVDGQAGRIAVDDQGRMLAVLNGTDYVVWDLTSADAEPRKYQAGANSSAALTQRMWWVSPVRLINESTTGLVLYNLEHQASEWFYRAGKPLAMVGMGRAKRTHDFLDGHMIYVADRGTFDREFVVCAVELPGPKVDEMTAQLNRDDLMILKPGAAVRLTVSAGQHTRQVQAALEQKIVANGWQLVPNAEVVVKAEIKRGKTQKITYESMHGPGDREQTVSVTPYISSVQVMFGQQVAWQSSTATGAPHFMRLAEGESVQDEVNKYQVPNPQFFEKLAIPDRILDPAYERGLGVTRVTADGLVPE